MRAAQGPGAAEAAAGAGGRLLAADESILHDWTDARAATILSHCRRVLPPGGAVLIVEPGGRPWPTDHAPRTCERCSAAVVSRAGRAVGGRRGAGGPGSDGPCGP
ncbi:methyltransferase [Streptomyces sp. IMTB 1903]|uniref:methyltransferase n=1 Tax=Streptomyces sp. IMTB 1903 TaxID=1776680 RepID=UPI00099EA1A8